MTTAAGYSGTPLPRKLGIKPGHRVLYCDAPAGFDPGPLPDDVTVDEAAAADAAALPAGPYDIVLAFVPDLAALTAAYAALPSRITKSGSLWICWPKKSSGVVTDVGENAVRDRALALPDGLVDVKVAAVDQTWSGLKLVYRLANR